MEEFSYLSVLLSVILGLAVTQILKGFRWLLLSRAHSDLLARDWMGHLRVTSVFSELVVDVWNAQPSGLEFVLLRTILIYMIAGLVFPDFFGDASVDLKESF
jgi:hypothetical protein